MEWDPTGARLGPTGSRRRWRYPSCSSMALWPACSIVLLRIAVFLPVVEGSPIFVSMMGSIRNDWLAPQPVAWGALKALSISESPAITRISPLPLLASAPNLPLIGLLGGGGLVLPFVRWSMIGLAFEPM